jgi:hypothetical protein
MAGKSAEDERRRAAARKLVAQANPCKQVLEALVFAKVVILGIDFDVRKYRGALLISLLQKQHDFPLLA